MLGSFHFYVVFNPLLKPSEKFLTQAHEFHQLLRQRSNHLYWGKIRKTDKNVPIDLNHYQSVMEKNKQLGSDTFLFISDFNFFWVAKVEAVSLERPPLNETLSIYEHEDVELWFKLTDMDLLCANPFTSKNKIAELSMNNSFYPQNKVKSLNPYIGGLRYPLIVDDISAEAYFTKYKFKKRIQKDNPLINESLQVNLLAECKFYYTIPKNNFDKLPLLLKKKVMWAEEIFSQINERSADYQENLSKAAFSYLRILEAFLNFSLMKEVDVRVLRPGEFQDLSALFKSLNSTSYHGRNLDEMMKSTQHDKFWEFCKIDMRNFLNVKVNGHALHAIKSEELLPTQASLFIRNSMLGVGCKGIINEMIDRYQAIEKTILSEEELLHVG